MIIFPQDGMRSDLERLWRTCFDDPEEYIKFFFEQRYVPENCIAFVDDAIRRPVAMLFLLSAEIPEDYRVSPAQYVYAACTRPDYRGRGIMSNLIKTAVKLGNSRGFKYSITVPAEPSLFRYYARLGFHRCYKIRMVYMSRSDLEYLSSGASKVKSSMRYNLMTLSEIFAFRRDMIADMEGYVSWDANAFRYAVGSHEQAGGNIITLKYNGDMGYAFCNEIDGVVEVTEFMAREYFAPMLISRILRGYPRSEKFKFRLPVSETFFEKYGEILDFAMICRNDGKPPVSMTTLEGRRAPYLGLPLD